MCEGAAEGWLYELKYCLDGNKTQYMCDYTVEKGPCVLRYVCDLFVTPKILDSLDKDDYLVTWCNDCKQRRAWKA